MVERYRLTMTIHCTNADSRTLAMRAALSMPGGVSSPVRALRAVGDSPIFIASGSGSRLTDTDGNTLIDYIGSWGAAIAGHSHPTVVEAVERAARDGLSFGATTRLEVDLAETVKDRVPGVEMVRFVCSGTEAVMSAIRLARAVTKRSTVMKFVGGYHGHGDSLLASSGSGVATFGFSDSPGVTAGTSRDTVALPYNDIGAVDEYFDHSGDSVACVIVEPVAGNMGVVPPRPGFLEGLRRITHAHGALLIFDEVMTGFRVARGGAQDLYGITADIVTLGKIIGGGLPVAAYAGKSQLMQQIAPAGPVYQAGTMAGNPIGMAAGLATLSLLTPRAYSELETRGAQLEAGLKTAFEQAGARGSVQRVGSMITAFFGVAEVRDFSGAQEGNPELFARCFRAMRQHGVLLPPGAFESWFISMAHGSDDISETLVRFGDFMNSLTETT